MLIEKKNFRHHSLVKDVRQNKGSILRATVEYVRALKEDTGRLEEKLRSSEIQQRKMLRVIQVDKSPFFASRKCAPVVIISGPLFRNMRADY